LYYEGWGVPKNRVEAIKHYYAAANLGISDAQYNLGALYYYGECVPRSLSQAFRWFSLAAKQGDEAAAANLEGMKAQMTPFDLSEGLRLLRASHSGRTRPSKADTERLASESR
jgi:TPR repeat protein